MHTLPVRLFAAFLFITLVVIIILGLALFVLVWQTPLSERLTLTRLNTVAQLAVRQFPPPDLAVEGAPAYVAQVAPVFGERILVLVKSKVVADSQNGTGRLTFLPRQARSDPTVPGGQAGRARDDFGGVWVYVSYPAGAAEVVVAAPETRLAVLQYFGDNLLAPVLEAGVVAAILSALLSILIARSIASPLQRMAVTAQAIARGDYTHPAPVTGPKEVRTLGAALNSMAGEVQAAQQAQREFVANVSHELKTPLTSIQGFAQAIVDGAASSPEALRHAGGIIYDEADRLRRLVEGLLDLARLDAGRGAFHRAPVDLRLVLGVTADKFSLRAREKGVALQTSLPPVLPTLVGDADRLAQVFTNLLDNALKHTPQGGRVMLAAASADGGLAVSVADTGEGIPLEDQQHIFERFYQVDKSRARPEARSGAGLGLTISKEIVEAHEGRVRVESVPGLGSKFTVWLPLALASDETVIARRPAAFR
jgi:signal transduction histidine kinase